MSLLCFAVRWVLSSWGRESWLLYFCCVMDVMLCYECYVIFDSSSGCHGFGL